MTGVGWARNETDALRARLLLWLSEQSKGGQAPMLASFGDDLNHLPERWSATMSLAKTKPWQAEQRIDISTERMDTIVSPLETTGLVKLHRSFGGFWSTTVILTARGKASVQEMRDALANRGLREVAIREALVYWLNEQRLGAPQMDRGGWAVDLFFRSPQAVFCGSTFTKDEQDRALRYLRDKGLIENYTAHSIYAVRLTGEGVDCASEYNCDVREYLQARNRPPGVAYHQTIETNWGMIGQGQTVTQTQHQADSGPVLGAIAGLLQAIAGDDSEDADQLRGTVRLVQDEAQSDTPNRGVVARLVKRISSIGGKAETAAISGGVAQALPHIVKWAETLT
jgi:hypothetical protein